MIARTTRLIIAREVREATRRKGVWALVAFTFLGATGLTFLPGLVGGDDEEATVMVVGIDDVGLTDALALLDDPTIVVTIGADRDSAVDAVEQNDVDLAVILQPPVTLLVEDEGSRLVDQIADVVTNRFASESLADNGIDPSRVRDAFVDAAPSIEPIDDQRAGRELSALGITMVLYILTVVLTSQVATGVAVEKSNRVSEVLLAIVPARSLLFGKVIGVGCIGLVTLLAGVVPVAVKILSGGDLPDGVGRTIVASAIWFIGGLALYLTIAGALGALVARQEEAGAVVVPLTGVLVVGYFVAISSGDSTLGAVLAYVPLVSPMIEPYRIATGAGSPIEYVLSAVALAVAVFAAGRVGAVVFRRAIVHTGSRIRLRDLLTPRRG